MAADDASAEPTAEVLDEYLRALQAGDEATAAALQRDHPRLAGWSACLHDLDALAETLAVGSGSVDAAPEVGALPRRFGSYELLEEIGRGGMGVVYRARQVGLERDVALKLLSAGNLASAEQRRRFLVEARLAAGIRHPRIVAVHDAGDLDGQPWCAMDLVEGEDLATRIRSAPLAVRDAVRMVADLARAVEHLHASGVVHRDIKPSNVILDATSAPHLADFGLARGGTGDATATGTILGTPASMAPEQAAGRNDLVDARTDVYGIGVVLYEALCGRAPFGGATAIDTLLDVIERDPLPPRHFAPTVPRDVERLCLRCLEKNRSRRPPSAAYVAGELERWLAGGGIDVGDRGLMNDVARLVRRHPAAAFRLVGILGTLVPVVARCVIDPSTLAYYRPVIAGLSAWALLSVFWEWVGEGWLNVRRDRRDARRAAVAKIGLVLTDVVSVTALLGTVRGGTTPLVAVYPLLVAASGLWLDRRIVRAVTVACLAAFGTLLAVSAERVPWHVATIVAVLVVVTAAITDFQMARVRAPRPADAP